MVVSKEREREEGREIAMLFILLIVVLVVERHY